MCVVGDYEFAEIVDLRMEQVVTQLRGHVDYSFCCAWNPLDSKVWEGRKQAKGNDTYYDGNNHNSFPTRLLQQETKTNAHEFGISAIPFR